MKAQGFRLNLIALVLLTFISARAAPPVVSNVRAQQRAGTQYVDIFYNVSDPDGDSPLRVRFEVSADGGASYTVPVFSFSGAVGPNVLPGNDRLIVWNAGADWPGQFTDRCRVRVIIVASQRYCLPASSDSVFSSSAAQIFVRECKADRALGPSSRT
jgi:hypothetical protein